MAAPRTIQFAVYDPNGRKYYADTTDDNRDNFLAEAEKGGYQATEVTVVDVSQEIKDPSTGETKVKKYKADVAPDNVENFLEKAEADGYQATPPPHWKSRRNRAKEVKEFLSSVGEVMVGALPTSTPSLDPLVSKDQFDRASQTGNRMAGRLSDFAGGPTPTVSARSALQPYLGATRPDMAPAGAGIDPLQAEREAGRTPSTISQLKTLSQFATNPEAQQLFKDNLLQQYGDNKGDMLANVQAWPRDVGRSVKHSALAGSDVFSGMAQGAVELEAMIRKDFIGATDKLAESVGLLPDLEPNTLRDRTLYEKWRSKKIKSVDQAEQFAASPLFEAPQQEYAEVHQDLAAGALEAGGLPAKVAFEVSSMGTQLLYRLAAMKMITGQTYGEAQRQAGAAAKDATGYFSTEGAKQTVGHAAKVAHMNFITSGGEYRDRIQSAAITFAYMITPAFSGRMPTDALAKTVDILANFGITLGTSAPEIWARAEETSRKKTGSTDGTYKYFLAEIAPSLSTDVLYGLMTTSAKNGNDISKIAKDVGTKSVEEERVALEDFKGGEKVAEPTEVKQEPITKTLISEKTPELKQEPIKKTEIDSKLIVEPKPAPEKPVPVEKEEAGNAEVVPKAEPKPEPVAIPRSAHQIKVESDRKAAIEKEQRRVKAAEDKAALEVRAEAEAEQKVPLAKAVDLGHIIKPPKLATFVRVTTPEGGKTVLPVGDIDTLKGAGPFKSVEFGVKSGKNKSFSPLKTQDIREVSPSAPKEEPQIKPTHSEAKTKSSKQRSAPNGEPLFKLKKDLRAHYKEQGIKNVATGQIKKKGRKWYADFGGKETGKRKVSRGYSEEVRQRNPIKALIEDEGGVRPFKAGHQHEDYYGRLSIRAKAPKGGGGHPLDFYLQVAIDRNLLDKNATENDVVEWANRDDKAKIQAEKTATRSLFPDTKAEQHINYAKTQDDVEDRIATELDEGDVLRIGGKWLRVEDKTEDGVRLVDPDGKDTMLEEGDVLSTTGHFKAGEEGHDIANREYNEDRDFAQQSQQKQAKLSEKTDKEVEELFNKAEGKPSTERGLSKTHPRPSLRPTSERT